MAETRRTLAVLTVLGWVLGIKGSGIRDEVGKVDKPFGLIMYLIWNPDVLGPYANSRAELLDPPKSPA